MTNEAKVVSESPEAIPDVLTETPESTPGSEAINSRDAIRKSIEERVIEENEKPSKEVKEEVPVEAKKEEESKQEKPVETSDLAIAEKVKERIQKRIDKEVAKRKTLEEQLAEKEAELQALRNSKPEAETKNVEPTIEQCEAYIIKCREEGDVKNEVAAMRYLVKLEKEAAIKAVKEEQEARARQTTEVTAKQQADWIALNRDYESPEPDLNLANQNGLLYREAMKLFMDPDLREVYSDSDRIQGFRRAVHDSYRYIMENGLHKKSPSNTVETLDTTPRVKPKAVLADPSTDSAEETGRTVSKNLSDAEKVKEEILARRKLRYHPKSLQT